MNSVAAHMEYLLRKHNCVVLPGIGAFICNEEPAHFDAENDLLLCPPGRKLAFNELIDNNDGLVASSIARRHGISFDAACKVLADEAAQLRRNIMDCGTVHFGNLGDFESTGNGHITFHASPLAGINGYRFGLRPILVAPCENAMLSVGVTDSQEASAVRVEQRRRRISMRTVAINVAASLALLLTLGLLFVPPIRTNQPTQTASIAPVPEPAVELTTPRSATPVFAKETASPVESVPEAYEKHSATAMADEIAAVQEPAADSKTPAQPEQTAAVVRFKVTDPYCVIVASFPTRSQAETYITSHPKSQLDILEKDSKFRVYEATGSTYAMADAQKRHIAQPDAWVCRR